MICKNCNCQIPNDAVFCTNCGSVIENENIGATSLLSDTQPSYQNPTIVNNAYNVGASNAANNNINPAYANPFYAQQPAQPVQPTQPISNYPNQANVQPGYSNAYQSNQGFNPANSAYTQQPQNQAYVQQPAQTYGTGFDNGQRMSYIEFFNKFASKKTKDNAKYIGIVCIVTAVLSVVLAVMSIVEDDLISGLLNLIDFVFYAVFAVLNFKKKKWQVSLPVCIYGGIGTVVSIVLNENPAGIVALALSIYATKSLKQLEDAYKQYCQTNILPQSEI